MSSTTSMTPAQIAALPTTNAGDAITIALTSLLGPWGALAGLAFKFGSPFVAQLITNAQNAADPTPDEWAKLDALIAVPGEVLIPERAPATPAPAAAVPGPVLVPPK